MKEYMLLRPLIGDQEIDIPLPNLNDLERIKILKSFLNKKPVTVIVLGIKTNCYISLIRLKKVIEL